jgi:hypothetical protein
MFVVCILALMLLVFYKYQDMCLEDLNTRYVFTAHRSVGTLLACELVFVYYLVSFGISSFMLRHKFTCFENGA